MRAGRNPPKRPVFEGSGQGGEDRVARGREEVQELRRHPRQEPGQGGGEDGRVGARLGLAQRAVHGRPRRQGWSTSPSSRKKLIAL